MEGDTKIYHLRRFATENGISSRLSLSRLHFLVFTLLGAPLARVGRVMVWGGMLRADGIRLMSAKRAYYRELSSKMYKTSRCHFDVTSAMKIKEKPV
jgi:hypothetical protein